MKHVKRVLAALVAFVCALELGGCAAFGAPATTEQLLARYVANENVGDFVAQVNVGLNVSAMGVRASVPVTVDLRAADSKAHGTAEVDLSSLDTRPYRMEFYAELLDDVLNCYIGTLDPRGGQTTWKCWTIATTTKVDLSTLTELLSSSALTIIAKDSDPAVCYELTMPASKVLETAFDVTEGSAELAGMGEKDLLDAVGANKVRFGFTEDCLLRTLETGATFTFRSAQTNNIVVRTGVDVLATLSDYGKVDPGEVAIPPEVRQSAIPTAAPIAVMDVIGTESPLAAAVGE